MIRVAVLGACGRMGAAVSAAVATADDTVLAAAVDPAAAGAELCDATRGLVGGEAGAIGVLPSVSGLEASRIDVAVDFTTAQSARDNLGWCADNRVHAVCGTTGLGEADEAELGRLFAKAGVGCVLAPNFSIGAVLMMRLAETCAPFFSAVELIELHHDRKRDAPSGTSLSTARRIEEARRKSPQAGSWVEEATEQVVLEGARGGLVADGVHVHSVRLPGLLAHHEVIFGSVGETLTIRHDSTDRASFMPGVLLAVRQVAGRPGLTKGLEPLLGL